MSLDIYIICLIVCILLEILVMLEEAFSLFLTIWIGYFVVTAW